MGASIPAQVHEVLIVGGGFGGIGMAVMLKRAGIRDFLILERGAGVGGVWRDNTYPGAACDVPSHLYSFSFEPNPDWSRRFASQDEIHAYLRHCADKYGLADHLRCHAEVSEAAFDEPAGLWRVRLRDGEELAARTLITATGQLSNPILPRIEGIESFRGPAFHSSRWDHGVSLAGKRVAVIGTGASSTQFVPAIAPSVASLAVFQRSPSWIIPRPDKPYPAWRKALFKAMPWTMRLHRAIIYSQYESRALAFTRARWILQVAAGMPFRRMLARQVPDASLRARLTPDYPIGCKRVLLSSDYLETFSRPNVELVTEGIVRITPDGIETADGKRHAADVIVYGTGFAATRFLAPMRITGRGGLDLTAAWAGGASSYLGMTVPGFPNFFMLYGPNTNLGHNSIIYMLESQFAHVLRALEARRVSGATEIEVQAAPHRAFNASIQARLEKSAWVGCNSWYLDANGRNTVNWPGFTLSYRWLARHARLSAYQFTRPGAVPYETRVLPPPSRLEEVFAAQNRLLLRAVFRPLVGPPLGLHAQRRVVDVLGLLMPAALRVGRERCMLGGVPAVLALPRHASAGAILYLHGGAFCLGSTWSHRGLTTRLARSSGVPVWTPDYRLAPEHPYPAALDDAVACYDALLAGGLRANQIVVAGDSAGAALAMALLLRLRLRQRELPAGAAMLSPGADMDVSDPGIEARAGIDPMLRPAWLRQAFGAYACPPDAPEHRPLAADLAGFPPLLIQVGSDEILLGDAQRLAAHAQACGVDCGLEVFEQRWHVFQLQGAQLASARSAIDTIGEFARERLAARGGEGDASIAAGHVEHDEKPVPAAP
ncbi:Baeyer-Villiger monooxygenase [Massilia sp. Bi118]|uniref:flavin-containing monooxygenase n=1 Tax=Massilia sp. Bi118 TaxID=2822346 RepID=UPI001D6E7058|nr:alpha/beta hydrolase fold domain-containing protein [Massilia sp. Bi118]CAH0197290.1 Baeyer-Villiger monooxygenase [Massilia sp. Bi118]